MITRFIGKILALPFRMVLLILLLIPGLQVPPWLTRWIWLLDRSSDHAVLYLSVVAQNHQYDSIQQLSEQLFSDQPSCSIASYAGLLALQHGHIDTAVQWFEKAKAYDQGDQELVLHLEMDLSNHLEGHNDEEFVARILERREVSMKLTQRALERQAFSALLHRQWQDAQNILDRIFHIDDPLKIRWMRWVTAAGMGLQKQAEQFYHDAWKPLKAKEAAMYKAYGWYILGDSQQGRSALNEAISAGVSPEVINAFCREMSISLHDSPVAGPGENT
jgi:hypothetical protein